METFKLAIRFGVENDKSSRNRSTSIIADFTVERARYTVTYYLVGNMNNLRFVPFAKIKSFEKPICFTPADGKNIASGLNKIFSKRDKIVYSSETKIFRGYPVIDTSTFPIMDVTDDVNSVYTFPANHKTKIKPKLTMVNKK